MRIIEAINRIDSLKHNTYTQPEKIAWLSTLDSMAKAHVIDTHEGGENVTFSGYDQNTDLNTVLLIPAPYEEAYIKWLEAQIDYANGEYRKYNNAIESFNTFWNAYKNYYNRTYRPLRNHVRYFGGNRNPGAGSPGNPGAMAQILGMIGDLKKLNTEDKSSLVAAINEVLRKGADPEEVERIVGAYLAENGIGGGIHIGPYPPDDPNVDIWLDTSEEETPPYIPNTINAKPGQIVRVVTVDENGAIVAVEAVDMPSGGESYELPAATADALGGVKAEPATEADTQPVRIGADGMLYTKPGGGEVWETIVDYTVPEDCAQVFLKTDINGNPFKLKRAIVTLLLFPAAGLTSEEWPVYTVDGTVDNVYGSNHYRYGAGYIPYETGMYRLTKFEVVQMPDGVHLLTVRETKTPAAYDENGEVTANGTHGFLERFNAKTLAPVVTEISAVGIGYYMTAIGAGTRIIMQGVRE